MIVQFFMPMIPPTVTEQEHRITAGKPGQRALVYDSDSLKDAREKLTAHLAIFTPKAPMDGALRLVVKWCFPTCDPKRYNTYKPTRPDTDNLQKLFKDCMTKLGYWHDDAQVASDISEKFYAETPGIFVRVEEINE